MWRSPSRSPEIRDDWTSCTAFCARAWQRPQCVTSVALRAKWKLRFAPCGSIGVQPRRATLAEPHSSSILKPNLLKLKPIHTASAALSKPVGALFDSRTAHGQDAIRAGLDCFCEAVWGGPRDS